MATVSVHYTAEGVVELSEDDITSALGVDEVPETFTPAQIRALRASDEVKDSIVIDNPHTITVDAIVIAPE
jgi:hypothetical protein